MTNHINAFPGYEFVYFEKDKQYHNMFRGDDVGKGGFVYAVPGMYGNVATLDIISQHPNSIIALNYFGEYTPKYKELLDTRIAIKKGDFDTAKKMFDGRLEKYLQNKEDAAALSQALKIAINSFYGMTSAHYSNPCQNPRNQNNIVALRGALFMRTLLDEVRDRGFVVAHIKTDSIKIPDATPEIIQFCMDFAKKYSYQFEHESTYDKICLVNEAVFCSRYASQEKCIELYGYVPGDNKKHPGEWTATGTQFAVPYIFKSLFTREEIAFEDLCETKSVKSALYLDMNEALPDVSAEEKEYDKLMTKLCKLSPTDPAGDPIAKRIDELSPIIEKGHDYRFVGRVGLFCPIKSGFGGGVLYRESKTKGGAVSYAAVSGTSGYRWLESETVKDAGLEHHIDTSYFEKLKNEAEASIREYGVVEWFTSDKPYDKDDNEILPF